MIMQIHGFVIIVFLVYIYSIFYFDIIC